MRYVKYIGPSHRRMITAEDWRTVGVTADTVVWSAFNGFAVPLDQFSDDQVRKAIHPDSFLIITGEDEEDGDEEFTPTIQTHDMTPDQLVQTVENPVDVVTLANTGDNVSTDRSDDPADAAPNGGDTANEERRNEVLEGEGSN